MLQSYYQTEAVAGQVDFEVLRNPAGFKLVQVEGALSSDLGRISDERANHHGRGAR